MFFYHLKGMTVACYDVFLEMAPWLLFGFLVAGILSLFLNAKFVSAHLGGKGIVPSIKAALFGVPLPLCSCSVIPVAASLRKNGAGVGSTLSFLISTPQTGVDSILVTWSLLGPVFAVFRAFTAFFSGIFGGILAVVLKLEREQEVESPIEETNQSKQLSQDSCCSQSNSKEIKPVGMIKSSLHHAFVTLPADIARPLLMGVLISGLISWLLPPDFFSGSLGGGILPMLLMILAGIPLYVCATASVPIAAALMAGGLTPGAAFVFLTAGPASNAATITTVWKLFGKKVVLLYLSVMIFTAIGAGWLLDVFIGDYSAGMIISGGEMIPHSIQFISAIMLLFLFIPSFLPKKREKTLSSEEVLTYVVDGIHCEGCASKIRNALLLNQSIASVEVNVKEARVKVFGRSLNEAEIKTQIIHAGFTIKTSNTCCSSC